MIRLHDSTLAGRLNHLVELRAMRKMQYETVLRSLQTLHEANSEMRQFLLQQQFPSALHILADSQALTASVVNYIDSVAREGTHTTALLQDYCEFLQAASLGLNRGGRRGFIGKLDAQLSKIEKLARHELKPNRLEVVFLPYTASMWDSLESIYLAAKADPACDAYCIPIPWYEKNRDGSFHTMHYEGDQFPANIEITDYRGYDIAARHPDVIFGHNPYDGQNYVTSVDPKYFFSNLKEHTDYLVYVDYGITHWTFRDAKKEAAHIKNLVLPAYIYCDLHACYSQEFAETMRTMLWLNKEHLGIENEQQLHRKAVALGSPKFDKVLSAKREDYPLPPAWRDILSGPKKVILFNTSIAPMLADSKGFLERLQSILQSFHDAEDAVLWWRPHPLLQNTFDNLRSEYSQEYRRMVEEYIRAGRGVYDDTAQLHRAIAWSDAYYGDESSLVYLYCATGKPFTLTTRLLENTEWFTESDDQFATVLQWRLHNMQTYPGANPGDLSYGSYENHRIWWYNFSSSCDLIGFLHRFIHYVVHTDEYPAAGLYEELQRQLFTESVTNSDGTAGWHIYNYCKQQILGGN